MIQLNLLPAVKLDYIKAQRSRKLVLSLSILVTVVAVAILVLLLLVDIAQKKHLSDLNRDINNESQTLKNEPSIGKILTVQNQLESLTTLHSTKPAASRIFSTYLNEITPANVNISSFHIDFTQQTASLTGTADALSSVNTYVDTLKFTNYTSSTNSKSAPAFKNVVLSSFGVGSTGDPSQAANYTITLAFDPAIFNTTDTVTLAIPKQVTTRSVLAQPTDLFKSAPAKTSGGGQ